MPDLFDNDPDAATDMKMAVLELRRELLVRRNVFPGWIRKGTLSQELADHRIKCFELLVEHFEKGES